ncbi:hypothetical protein K435DRAFT_777564 [Dendrothele bispora CBS 962.96]|uniref:Uncharacterized protein n=1 Tax=Dendrothele bispora (strain CBS 962.96) TaxID=1314807 RepID=A0A4S8M871_DENBC|nr:hypothetical protein K435DRAFT_777564 [Dendrothele bispora CBS 962.96]
MTISSSSAGGVPPLSAQHSSRTEPDAGEARASKRSCDFERISDRKKRKRNQTEDYLKPFKHAAQWFSRTKSMYIAIGTNLHVAWALTSNAEDPILEGMSDRNKEWHRTTYRQFLKHTPGLEAHLLQLKGDDKEEELEHFVVWLESQASQGRNADTTLLKSRITWYMLEDPSVDVLTPPIPLGQQSKSTRGFNHPYIAALLCPRKYRAKFLADPERIAKKMKDGILKVDNSSLPFFCYDRELYDVDDLWKSLFRNTILIRAARAVLFGESKGLNGIDHPSHAPRKSNACNNGIKKVDEGFIAMICCQVRFALSSVERWGTVDEDFHYDIFHQDILFTFETDYAKGGYWADSVLRWWNVQLFRYHPTDFDDNNCDEDSDAETGNDKEVLLRGHEQHIAAIRAAVGGGAEPEDEAASRAG